MNKKYQLKEALNKYIHLLQEEQYFYAHEVLEEVWHPLRKENHPLKNLIKGLINAAISLEHLKRNRIDAKRKAATVFKSFERHKHLLKEEIEEYTLFKSASEKIEKLYNLQ